MSVLAMPREYYQRLKNELDRQLEEMEGVSRSAAEKRARESVVEKSKTATPFITVLARQAFASLNVPLEPAEYSHLARAASPNNQTKNISSRVHYALTKH